MKNNVWLAGLALGGVLIAHNASAEMIQGVVNYIDPMNNMIGVRQVLTGEPARQYTLLVEEGFKPGTFSTGQIVNVEAQKRGTMPILKAESIEVTGNALASVNAAAISA